ncbi:MAG: succinate dehydrogenase cytochrome b subunit [Flavobacteriales bacterium]|nr:succinate dehydrogenase cytochrome b subunit [Flavobacteriales bacterium]MCZ2442277.1 succinate dehydrogenase cytochrome b subunit [Flavobacteriales bacterium]
MSSNKGLFKSSITKKIVMGLTGLFLITFLIVHAGVNALIFLNDGGQAFLKGASFMGTNPLIRIFEIVLVLGLLLHIIDGIIITRHNKMARPIAYYGKGASANSTWYSRSMGILGLLILLFLIIHSAHFWIPNRYAQFTTGHEIDLFGRMKFIFSHAWIVGIYVGACIALSWHLMHGFKSAFQSLGLNHSKYNPIIKTVGFAFSIVCPLVFAMMPISMYFGLIQ